MIAYQPVYARRVGPMGQNGAPAPVAPTPIVVNEYKGVPGFIETVAVLGASAAAAYTGIKAGMSKTTNKKLRTIGWIGGIGGALLGLLYLGTKTGVSSNVSLLPQVKVSPQ